MKEILEKEILDALNELYQHTPSSIDLQKTRKDFEGDITLVVFPFLSCSKKSPEKTANEIGEYLIAKSIKIDKFNVVKGFLNISISFAFWYNKFKEIYNTPNFGIKKPEKYSPVFLIEYSSPNTNKPLHLGHIRNILLGYSISKIINASGKNVKKVQVINDRGIHICKSMVAWQLYGNNETPKSSGLKGDHLVGKYYVLFEKKYRQEVDTLINKGYQKEKAEREASIFLKAQNMLLEWERRNPEVIALWDKMNSWVYDGFEATYERLGVNFDKDYYESNTYVLGKKVVEEGLERGVFFKKKDGSVWIDLSKEGLDEKIILRSDGTAVYITQDIGTAIQRYIDFSFSNMVYTVGNEQDYHFKVLFLILEKLGYTWAKKCYHLSYGMVDLPSGRMKSREGTVVDADDLMEEMVNTSTNIANDLGKLEGVSKSDANILYETVGLGALKYFILKVDPKKRMLFNPDESVDFNGNTGPFIQYTYARIKSLERNYKNEVLIPESINILFSEKEIIKKISMFPEVINESANSFTPAIIANYVYELSKLYNNYYQSISILNAKDLDLINFRLCLSLKVGETIKNSMNLLGVDVPNRM
ncbi:MAG: arginine--tRNA ligase [Flavobacteriales bacterium]|nr:arginine--tRNA ligase [Flavobacteriales bacterium]